MPALSPFQDEVIFFMDDADGRVIYADAVGGRKTGTTLSWLEQADAIDKVLIVAPKSVHLHWFREATRFAPRFVHLVGTGTPKQRDAALNHNDTDAHIYITTYESMKIDEAALVAHKFDCVIFDEAHRLKGRRNATGLASNAVTAKVPFLLLLTGTPVLNGAEEVWQYLHLLDRRKYPAFWKWALAHFVVEIRMFRGNRFPTRIIHDFLPGQGAVVRAQLEPYLIQRDIHELFAGEPWVEEPDHVVIPVQLSPRERKLYKSLVDHNWGREGLTEIVTENKLALTTRLSQLSSDWGTLDADLELGAKTLAAAELIVDLAERESIVVFVKYQETANRLAALVRRSSLTAQPYHGGIDVILRDHMVQDFRNGHLKVIVGTLAALGEGVDGLQYHGSTIVMLDRDWTPARNEQAIGRRRRSGQTERVTVYHVYAEDTMDVAVVSACLRKTNVVESLRGRPLSAAIYGTGIDVEVE